MLVLARPAAVQVWSLIAHVGQPGSVLAATTTPARNTINADLIVVGGMSYGSSEAIVVSDSQGNNWTYIDRYLDIASGNVIGWAYVHNPVTSTSHTFTVDAGPIGGTAVVVIAQAWSGSVAAPLDQHSVIVAGAGPTIPSLAITPTQTNCLVVSFAGFGTSGGSTGLPTVDQSFVRNDGVNDVPGVTFGGVTGSLQQAVPASVNPTWTAFGADSFSGRGSVLASFKSH